MGRLSTFRATGRPETLDLRSIKHQVAFATAAPLPAYARSGNVITASAVGALTGAPACDGVTPAVGMRFLHKDPPDATTGRADCGIYQILSIGGAASYWSACRVADANESYDFLSGMLVAVEARSGASNGGTLWRLSIDTASFVLNGSTSASYVDFVPASQKRVIVARAATTAALPACTYASPGTLTGNVVGALTAQDGVTLVLGDLLLVKNQVTGAQNGLYAVARVGDASYAFVLSRAELLKGDDVGGVLVMVSEGTLNGRAGGIEGTLFCCTNADGGGLVDTSALVFARYRSLSIYASKTPGNTDDVNAGFLTGHLLYDQATRTLYACEDNTASNAVWNIRSVKTNYTAVVDPTVDDDVDLGYAVGSVWINTLLDTAYICTDSTDGTAMWLVLGPGPSALKAKAVCATTADLPGAYAYAANVITGPAATPLGLVDGVSPVATDVILVRHSTGGAPAGIWNGLYEVLDNGAGVNPYSLRRVSGWRATEDFSGALVEVTGGTEHHNTIWMEMTQATALTDASAPNIKKLTLAHVEGAAPTAADNAAAGYQPGNFWYDTAARYLYVLRAEAVVGTATWDQITAKCNFGATAPPALGDDSDDGYSPGSIWVDTTNGEVYDCQSATVGAAEWTPLRSRLFKVRCASTQDLAAVVVNNTMTETTPDGVNFSPTVDGVVTALNDDFLAKDEGTGNDADNGVYRLTTLGTAGPPATPWVATRVPGMRVGSEADGAVVEVQEGTAHAGLCFREVSSVGGATVGTDTLGFDLLGAEDAPPKLLARVTSTQLLTVPYASGYTVNGNALTETDPTDGAWAAVDGVGLTAGQTFFLRHGTAVADNGLYILAQVGDGVTVPWRLVRAPAMRFGDRFKGAVVQVQEGTLNRGLLFRSGALAATSTIGTHDPLWMQAITIAATAPTVTEDVDLGYFKGCLWFDTATRLLYVLEVDTSGAPVWNVRSARSNADIPAAAPSLLARDPTIDDDITFLYEVGSLWYNTTADRAWICLDNANGAAVWHRLDLRSMTEPVAFCPPGGMGPYTTDGTTLTEAIAVAATGLRGLDANGGDTDGVVPAVGMRFLLAHGLQNAVPPADGGNDEDNGIYRITSVGTPAPGGTAWTAVRDADFLEDAVAPAGMIVPVSGGLINGRSQWQLRAGGTIATDPMIFKRLDDGKAAVVRVASTAALAASDYLTGWIVADAIGALAAQDGETLAKGDRILLRHEAANENGIYDVVQAGGANALGFDYFVLRRVSDLWIGDTFGGKQVRVTDGTLYADTEWHETSQAGPVGWVVGVSTRTDVVDTNAPDFRLNNCTFVGTGAPGAATHSSTEGFAVGSVYLNEDTGLLYVCEDDTAGAAEWTLVGSYLPEAGDGTDLAVPPVLQDITIAVNTPLAADVYCDNYTVNAGVTVRTQGYRVHARTRILNNGTIVPETAANLAGGDGGAGAAGGGAAGVAGTACPAGTTGGSGAGGIGAVGGVTGSGAGAGGTVGANQANFSAAAQRAVGAADGTASGAGGNGGDADTGGTPVAGGGGGALAAGGDASAADVEGGCRSSPQVPVGAFMGASGYSVALGGAGGAGAGGGGGGATDGGGAGGGGGGGGGGGAGGGVVILVATIVDNQGTISAPGGIGGNGGVGEAGAAGGANPGGGGGGGGGGGAGGGGGFVGVLCRKYLGNVPTAPAGANGTPGAGGNGGTGTPAGDPGVIGNAPAAVAGVGTVVVLEVE